ncbi:MAG: hypothetical protein ACTHYN_02655 [Marinobacter sp.]|uniref:hypothetical protein n=1 Tax=Marinobacter sp. TaxID=50741 RepID=UPI003F9955B5
MKNKTNEHEADPCLPGGLLPVEQWALPQTSVHRSLKDAIGHVLKQLRAGVSQAEEPFESMDQLPELSTIQKKRLVPEPDHSGRAAAIAYSLNTARSEGVLIREVACLVAPPFSGVEQALAHFSQSGQQSVREAGGEAWRRIRPPDTLLLDARAASEWWDKQDLSLPWVIPELSNFWLRHISGLALVKELFRRIASGEAGAGIVGCSSWCWQYWGHYLENAQMSPMTPAPMESERLGAWFTHLASGSDGVSLVARMAVDGSYVLPLPETADAKKEQGTRKRKHSTFLRDLAATSRGNPGVALAIWQRALRARPDDDASVDEADEKAKRQSRTADCWVVPLEQLNLPTMPQSQESITGFVLHGLLLHNGLDAALLEAVTGVCYHQLSHVLSRLQRAELVVYDQSDERWQVTAIGYPTVRRHLQSWGFPVDQF